MAQKTPQKLWNEGLHSLFRPTTAARLKGRGDTIIHGLSNGYGYSLVEVAIRCSQIYGHALSR